MSDRMQTPETVPGRSCGECSLCCKLPRIDAVDKPAGLWCRHCAPGRGGCTIYDSRPSSCRAFHCGWIVDARLGPEWQPLTSKMIAVVEEAGQRIAVHVDPSYPEAWRREPWYGQLRQWARAAVEDRRQVVVHVRRKAIVILADRDVDLGDVLPGQQIWVGAHDTAAGRRWNAVKIPADVPPGEAGSWITSQLAGKPAV
jgi:hypothetical protein